MGILRQTPAAASGRIASEETTSGHLPFGRGAGAEANRHHNKRFSAMGTYHGRRAGPRGSGNAGRRTGGRRFGGEELAGSLQALALAVVKEAKVADPTLTLGWHMNQKTTQKLVGG